MTPEEFLEHHGVKGMRWGVRTHEGSRAARAKQWAKRNKTAIKEVAAFTGIVVGAAVAGHYLAKAAGNHLSEIKATNVARNTRATTENFLKSNAQMTQAGMRRSQLSRQAMEHARQRKLLNEFDAKAFLTVAKANKDIAEGYARNQVPFPKREILRDWPLTL